LPTLVPSILPSSFLLSLPSLPFPSVRFLKVLLFTFSYNGSTGTWTWVQEPFFATDCQTWVMSVLGPNLVDSWFGNGTAYQIWQNTKKIAGFNYDSTTNMAQGVGFSENTDQVRCSPRSLTEDWFLLFFRPNPFLFLFFLFLFLFLFFFVFPSFFPLFQVFSGEWSFGAINMLRIFANEYSNTSTTWSTEFANESAYMRSAIDNQLLQQGVLITGNSTQQQVTGINYANKRFGFLPSSSIFLPFSLLYSPAFVSNSQSPYFFISTFLFSYGLFLLLLF
jgi:hypothetical protein